MPPKLIHSHEKISDAELAAVALLQRIHKAPYFKGWWRMVKLNPCPHFPSEVQARVRLQRLTPVIERVSVEVQCLDFVAVDSEPLPATPSRLHLQACFPLQVQGGPAWVSTAGPVYVYGFKLHAWTTLNGKIAQYAIRPANEHDFTVGCEMNYNWPAYRRSGVLMGVRSRRTGPKQIGDKGYQSGTYLTPPKKNAKQPDPRWKEEYAAARKIIESVFSALVGARLRWGQVKTLAGLRLKVALIVLAYNLKFRDLPPVP